MSRRICKPLSYNSPVNFHSLFDACEKHIRVALLKPLRHRVHLGNSQGSVMMYSPFTICPSCRSSAVMAEVRR
mgnify:CR=1 FL=1